jgi:acyl-ACP thioesterase
MELFGEAAGGRRVSARLHHADAPPVGPATAWPLRFTDFDVLGHVNNAAYWAIVEEQLARQRSLRAPLRAELEHRGALDVGAAVVGIDVDERGGGSACWLSDEAGAVVATATIAPSA